MQNGDNSSTNDPNGNRHELVSNLKTVSIVNLWRILDLIYIFFRVGKLFNEHGQVIQLTVLEEKYKVSCFSTSILFINSTIIRSDEVQEKSIAWIDPIIFPWCFQQIYLDRTRTRE